MQNDEEKFLGRAATWAWENREWILNRLKDLRGWLFSATEEPAASNILIIGPGGVGKSTLGRMLSGQFDYFLNIPGAYEESISLEEFALRDDEKVELVVPPGQRHRRDATWTDLQATVSAGGYRGIIMVTSYGYHSLGEISYKHHRLYRGNKAAFLDDFLAESRADEVGVLQRLVPYMQTNKRRSWVLTLVTKQDLWWREHGSAEAFYHAGKYGELMDGVIRHVGNSNLRHEFVCSSLVLSNFATGRGELLAETTAGYDQKLQIESVRRLFETLEALKNWEESI